MKAGELLLVGPLGPLSIVVSGGVVSTVNVRVAGVGSTLPAWSIARTLNVWSPSASVVTPYGDEHAWNAPPSSLHSNVAFGSLENENGGATRSQRRLGRRRIHRERPRRRTSGRRSQRHRSRER